MSKRSAHSRNDQEGTLGEDAASFAPDKITAITVQGITFGFLESVCNTLKALIQGKKLTQIKFAEQLLKCYTASQQAIEPSLSPYLRDDLCRKVATFVRKDQAAFRNAAAEIKAKGGAVITKIFAANVDESISEADLIVFVNHFSTLEDKAVLSKLIAYRLWLHHRNPLGVLFLVYHWLWSAMSQEEPNTGLGSSVLHEACRYYQDKQQLNHQWPSCFVILYDAVRDISEAKS